MAGDRVESDVGPYALVPERLLDSVNADGLRLSDRAVRLFVVLARYADRAGVAFPSRRTLGDRLGCSIDSIDRAIAELVEHGWIELEHRHDEAGGRQTSNLYRLRFATGEGRTRAAGVAAPVRPGRAAPVRHQEREPQGTITDDSVVGAGGELELASNGAPADAQALVAGYVDRVRALGVDAPKRTTGIVARAVGELLAEGHPPAIVERAIELLVERRLHPSTLPTLVLEAAAGPAPARRSESDLDRRLRRLTEGS